MHTSSTAGAPPSPNRLPHVGALLLLVRGLFGHLYAAHAIGGSRVAYTHHILGFGLILLVTGGIIAALGHRFWPSRWGLTLLAIGFVQALLGVLVALAPHRAAAGP